MYKLPPQPSSASDGVSPDTNNECHAAVGQFSIRNTFLLSCVQVYERGVLLVLRFLPTHVQCVAYAGLVSTV